MSDELSGRVAVVTGAARGIGDAIAERLLRTARGSSRSTAPSERTREGVVYLEATSRIPIASRASKRSTELRDVSTFWSTTRHQRVGLVASLVRRLVGGDRHAPQVLPLRLRSRARMVARGKGSIVSIARPRLSSDCRAARLLRAKAGILGLTRALSLRSRRRAFASTPSLRFHPDETDRAGAGGRVLQED